MNFEDLELKNELLQAVNELGYTTPTPIQTDAIPEIIGGEKDLIGLAPTGTGKTAAFGLPMIQLIDFDLKQTQGLILCPTRELCAQITGDLKKLSKFVKGAKIIAIAGGASMENQIREIKKGMQIIVATPGRLLDLINRKVVKLTGVSYVVLDEADEMLNMGFKEDLDAILGSTPDDKRVWLFSATMPDEVARITRQYMDDPVTITVGGKNKSAINIKHLNYIIHEKDRYQALKRILDFSPDIYGLIFCRTRMETQEIAEKLIKDNYDADALHGDLSQAARDHVMNRFRNRTLQILVATDVAARGLDVKEITHVINYRLPDEPQIYTHRSGRTARAGKSGTSIVITNLKEKFKVTQIEKSSGIKFTYTKVPGGYEVCEKQLYAMINRMVEVDVDYEEIAPFLPPVFETLEGLSKEELIQRFVSLEFNRFLEYYRDSKDINASLAKQREVSKGSSRGEERQRNLTPGKLKRFFMNAGIMDDLTKKSLVKSICSIAEIPSLKIGAIDIMREFSFFEVDSSVADKVLNSMKGAEIDGREINVEYAEKKSGKDRNPSKGNKFKKKR
ncbi:MAG: DEAD/DEAH box helicase [Deltaproteobacteria bacterium]|nr:DEAD/DEAH box helicase [Deltaproteobacteria bacterium]